MPCPTNTIDALHGPLMTLHIAHAEDKRYHSFTGLIDTGASATNISSRVIERLDMAAIGKTQVYGAGGVNNGNLYLVDMMMVMGEAHVPLPHMLVTEFVAPDYFDILLGRDVLSMGYFTLSFNGTYTFCI